jgi:hypothetical protein
MDFCFKKDHSEVFIFVHVCTNFFPVKFTDMVLVILTCMGYEYCTTKH